MKNIRSYSISIYYEYIFAYPTVFQSKEAFLNLLNVHHGGDFGGCGRHRVLDLFGGCAFDLLTGSERLFYLWQKISFVFTRYMYFGLIPLALANSTVSLIYTLINSLHFEQLKAIALSPTLSMTTRDLCNYLLFLRLTLLAIDSEIIIFVGFVIGIHAISDHTTIVFAA